MSPAPLSPTPCEAKASIQILLIDDDTPTHVLMERVLESRPGTTLVTAATGRAGTARATEHPPSLIILDSRLPDVSGIQVLQRLQMDSALRPVPVAVVSADATRENIDAMLAAGAREYLTKPFNLHDLLAAIDRLITPSCTSGGGRCVT